MKCLKSLFTKIRDKNTSHMEFVKYADRLMSIICEEGSLRKLSRLADPDPFRSFLFCYRSEIIEQRDLP